LINIQNYSKVSILRNASDEHSKEIKLHYDVVEEGAILKSISFDEDNLI